MPGQLSRAGPSGHLLKYTSWMRESSAPAGSLATPSYWMVFSPDQPTENEQAGLAVKFRYLREDRTVSKMTSRPGDTAMPTSEDCGAPSGETLPRTPRLWPSM